MPISDKQQELDRQLIYEYGYSANDVHCMSPKAKIKAFIDSSDINCDADTIIYLVESALGFDLDDNDKN